MSYDLRDKTTHLLDYLIIAILLGILALSPWPYGSVSVEAKYALHITCLAALFFWVLKKAVLKENVSFHRAYVPLLAFLAIALISITYSVYRYASIREFLNLVSYGIFYFLMIESAGRHGRQRLVCWGILSIGAVYCGYGLAQYFGYLPRQYWSHVNDLSSRFVNSGSFGAFVNINIFLCLGMLFSRRGITAKMFLAVLLGAFLVSLVLSKSRLSWIVFVLVMAYFALLSLKRRRVTRPQLFRLFGACVFVLAGAVFAFRSILWARFHVMALTQFQSLFQRLDVWIGTLKIILTHPLGVGIGGFQYIYPSYRIHSDRFLVDFAHSDILQIACEIGILGSAAFVWFLVRAFRQSQAETAPSAGAGLPVAGLMCAALSVIAQGVVDFPLQIPANALLFLTCLALIPAGSLRREGPALAFRAATAAILCAAIAASATLATSSFISNRYCRMGQKETSRFEWQEAIVQYGRSIRAMPINADAYAGRGSIYAAKTTLAFGPEKQGYRAHAISDLLCAVRFCPYQSLNYLNLAWLYADEGDREKALGAFRKAIATNPTYGAPYFPYADYCLEHGMLEDAVDAYRGGLGHFTEEKAFYKLAGGASSVFERIYERTQDCELLRRAVPKKVLRTRLEFAAFLESKKRIPEARQEYETILKENPGQADAQEALKRLRKE